MIKKVEKIKREKCKKQKIVTSNEQEKVTGRGTIDNAPPKSKTPLGKKVLK